MTGTIRPPSPSETAIPRCTPSYVVTVSSSSVALSAGNWRSVSIVARAMYGRYVKPDCLRAASMRIRSASTTVVQVAAVCSDSSIREPIAWRMRDSGAAPAAIGAGSAAAGASKRGLRVFAGAGSSGRYGLSMCIGGSSGAAPFSRNASTSCLRTRPPRPVPSTCSRSMPCSAAMRWTTGEYRRGPERSAGLRRGSRLAASARRRSASRRSRSCGPRPAWRRWRSAPARCRRRRSCRRRRAPPGRGRWPAPRRRCRSCRSRSRR